MTKIVRSHHWLERVNPTSLVIKLRITIPLWPALFYVRINYNLFGVISKHFGICVIIMTKFIHINPLRLIYAFIASTIVLSTAGCNLLNECGNGLFGASCCLLNEDCDDTVVCTTDTCDIESGFCSNISNCTLPEICDTNTGTCFGVCSSDSDCDNDDPCDGSESCVSNVCVAGIDLCPGKVCDVSSGNVVCVDCNVNADCDDDQFCNGIEMCDANNGTCISGTNPCSSCSICDEITDLCSASGLGCGSFTLTTAITGDAFTGTSGNDIFSAPIGTLQPVDILVGNGGNNDVLNATIANASSSLAR